MVYIIINEIVLQILIIKHYPIHVRFIIERNIVYTEYHDNI